LNKKPKISVVSACFNQGKFINEMVESVFSQTFNDFEIIIVNDGSTDDTEEILKAINHERVRIIHTENHGPANARNTAIKNASASIIMNLDADDKIAPDLLEKAYDIFVSRANAGIVYCDAGFFGAKSGKFNIAEYTLESMLFNNRIISLAFFRKEDWQAVSGYSGELIYGLEDWDFWLLIIELGRDVVKIPEKLVYYRTYRNNEECRSGRRKADRMKVLESMVIIFRRHKKLYSTCPRAWKHFSKLEKKFDNENSLSRLVKTSIYNNLKKYYNRLSKIFDILSKDQHPYL
jgi:glycosyltransferase involved in cell wall biosynthesis